MKNYFSQIASYKKPIFIGLLLALIVSQSSQKTFTILMDNQDTIQRHWLIAGSAESFYRENALHINTKTGVTNLILLELAPFVAHFNWADYPYIILDILPLEESRTIALHWSPNYKTTKTTQVSIPAFEDQIIIDIEKLAPDWVKSADRIGNISFNLPEKTDLSIKSFSIQSSITWLGSIKQKLL